MNDSEISDVNDCAVRLATSIKIELERAPLTQDQMRSALAVAVTLIVSYETMQAYLEELAACADARAAAAQMAGLN